MRKKEGRVKIQNIDNNSERANEYAEEERKKSFFFMKQIPDFLTGRIRWRRRRKKCIRAKHIYIDIDY
jgi:hypothetical protein